MKLSLALLGTLALSVAGQQGWRGLTDTPPTPAATPSGSGGVCTPGGCVLEPTALAEERRQERPWRNFPTRPPPSTTTDVPSAPATTPVGSGGVCTPGGCVIEPTASTLFTVVKRQERPWRNTPTTTIYGDEKRQERPWREFPTRPPRPTTDTPSTLATTPVGSGGVCTPGGCVVESTAVAEVKRQERPYRNFPTTTVYRDEKRQGGWHGDEKRQGGWHGGEKRQGGWRTPTSK
jgi:hypothetical protein